MSLTKLTENLNNISSLPDRPTETSEELKAKFDKAGNTIKEYINEVLTVEIEKLINNTASSSKTIVENVLTSESAVNALSAGQGKILDEKIVNMKLETLELAFPIGSTYITQTNTDPNTILGFGTWERLKGKILVGLDEDDTDFNKIGNIGGEKIHKIQGSELPIGLSGVRTSADGSDWQRQSATDKTASQKAMNIMPPFEVPGYMWIRRK